MAKAEPIGINPTVRRQSNVGSTPLSNTLTCATVENYAIRLLRPQFRLASSLIKVGRNDSFFFSFRKRIELYTISANFESICLRETTATEDESENSQQQRARKSGAIRQTGIDLAGRKLRASTNDLRDRLCFCLHTTNHEEPERCQKAQRRDIH